MKREEIKKKQEERLEIYKRDAKLLEYKRNWLSSIQEWKKKKPGLASK